MHASSTANWTSHAAQCIVLCFFTAKQPPCAGRAEQAGKCGRYSKEPARTSVSRRLVAAASSRLSEYSLHTRALSANSLSHGWMYRYKLGMS